MTNIEQWVRSDLLEFESYPVKQRQQEAIWLDMNELPWEVNSLQGLNRYPVVSPDLLAKVASYYEVKPSQLLLTRGSDDAIDLLIRLFCMPFQDEILICPPTFPMYALNAKVQGVASQSAPLQIQNNFAIDINNINAKISSKTKLLFLCSPNNPTGTGISQTQMQSLLVGLKEKLIVVVDEAYVEFSNEQSQCVYLKQFPNLVVLRTFSKAFGLAGIRCGAVLANEKIIQFMQKIMPPFAIPQPTMQALDSAMLTDNLQQLKVYSSVIQQERELLQQTIRKLPFVKKCWQSQANFILFSVRNAQALTAFCQSQGIVIKNFDTQQFLDNCVRISIGTPLENKKLLQVLANFGELC